MMRNAKGGELRQNWKTASIVMRLDVRSCKDSNGDGTGDIQGLIESLDYYDEIGIGAIQLSGHMPTDFAYAGTMHTGFYDVDPVIGSLDDFDHLIGEAHQRDIAVMSTWAPFSTHPNHPYFVASRDRDHPDHSEFADYFTWSDDCSAPLPHPLSRGMQIGHWEWDERRQSYFHATWKTYDDDRWCPETNPYSKRMESECHAVARFWLDLGLDGFWLDCGDKGDFSNYEDHTRFWKSLNKTIHSYPNRVSVSEDGTFPSHTIEVEGFDQFWTGNKPIPVNQTVFGDGHSTLVSGPSGQEYNGIHEILTSYYRQGPGNQCSQVYHLNEIIDFNDSTSLAKVRQYLTVALTMPVVPTLEMGVECGWALCEYDIWSRYGHSPMLWTAESGYGFTSGTPYRTINSRDYPDEATVAAQLADPQSVLSHFKSLALLRAANPALQANGPIDQSYRRLPTSYDDTHLVFVRTSPGAASFVVCFNFDPQPQQITLFDTPIAGGCELRPVIGGGPNIRVCPRESGETGRYEAGRIDTEGHGARVYEIVTNETGERA